MPRDCTFFYSWVVLDTMNFKIDLCSGVWQCDAMTIEIVIWLTIVQSLPWARSCRIFDELFLIKPLCDTSNILYLILNYAERKAYSSIRSTLIWELCTSLGIWEHSPVTCQIAFLWHCVWYYLVSTMAKESNLALQVAAVILWWLSTRTSQFSWLASRNLRTDCIILQSKRKVEL